jgi:hypothetical protein
MKDVLNIKELYKGAISIVINRAITREDLDVSVHVREATHENQLEASVTATVSVKSEDLLLLAKQLNVSMYNNGTDLEGRCPRFREYAALGNLAKIWDCDPHPFFEVTRFSTGYNRKRTDSSRQEALDSANAKLNVVDTDLLIDKCVAKINEELQRLVNDNQSELSREISSLVSRRNVNNQWLCERMSADGTLLKRDSLANDFDELRKERDILNEKIKKCNDEMKNIERRSIVKSLVEYAEGDSVALDIIKTVVIEEEPDLFIFEQ